MIILLSCWCPIYGEIPSETSFLGSVPTLLLQAESGLRAQGDGKQSVSLYSGVVQSDKSYAMPNYQAQTKILNFLHNMFHITQEAAYMHDTLHDE